MVIKSFVADNVSIKVFNHARHAGSFGISVQKIRQSYKIILPMEFLEKNSKFYVRVESILARSLIFGNGFKFLAEYSIFLIFG